MQWENQKGKRQKELYLAISVKDNKTRFYKYIKSKRGVKENLLLLLVMAGNVITEDEEEAEILKAFFKFLFNSQSGQIFLSIVL